MKLEELQNLKKNDVIYSMASVNGLMSEAFKVIKNDKEDNIIYFEGILGGIHQNKRSEEYSWIKKTFETYKGVCEYVVESNRDNLPYEREFWLIARKDEVENAEYYI
jgi:hypothetical protein